jgi:hypothetical protein
VAVEEDVVLEVAVGLAHLLGQHPAVGVVAHRGGLGLDLGGVDIGLVEADGGAGLEQPADLRCRSSARERTRQ